MKRNISREPGKSRQMRPLFLIICEGETEAEYIGMLKKKFHENGDNADNVILKTKTKNSQINKERIKRIIKEEKIGKKDRIFLLYDRDKEDVNKRLDKIKTECNDIVELYSNPCIEFWFLLHCGTAVKKHTGNECLNTLKNVGGVWSNYKKAVLTFGQENFLWDHRECAIQTARTFKEKTNPSSTIFRLFDKIEDAIK